MNKLRIVFMGTADFSSGILSTLIKHQYNIVGVVTKLDTLVGRKRILTYPSVKKLAIEHNINVIQVKNIKIDYQAVLDLKPDLIITAAYGQIIPTELLEYPKLGCINIHTSLLPKYRGGAPIHRAIMNNENQTGVTIMYMSEKMDEGDILYQRSINIDIKDTTSILFKKLEILASSMICEFLPEFIKGNFLSYAQDHTEATYAKIIKKSDEYINFNQEVIVVYNHIRSLLDVPCGYSICEDLRIKIHEASFEYNENSIPSKIYGFENDVIKVGCINGYIFIKKLQVVSKNVMTAKDFSNGYIKKVINKYFKEKDNEN